MTSKVRCPQCGKRARFSQEEVGADAICAACGFSFVVPSLAAPVVPTSAPTAGTQLHERAAGFPLAEPGQLSGIGAIGWGVVGVGSATVALLVALMVYALFHPAAHAVEKANVVASVSASPISDRTTPAPAAPAKAHPRPPAPQGNSAVAGSAHSPASSALAPSVSSSDAGPSVEPLLSRLLGHHPAAAAPASQPAAIVPGRPPVHAVAEVSDAVTDEQIGAAIQRGADHLLKRFDPKTFELREGQTPMRGLRRAKGGTGYHDGADALCVYALMQCGDAIDDRRLNMKGEFMIGAIDAMKKFPMDEQAGFSTYGRGIRATALALNDRPQDHDALKADVVWLLKVQKNGGYTYYKSDGNFDNSNSQYGLLGVWSGAEAEVEVPTAYWELVQKHWTETQNSDGQWGYNGRSSEGRLTMTCAGIASMFVCHDWLDAPRFGTSVGRDPFSPPLAKGLKWMEQGNHAVDVGRGSGAHWGYALYGIERVGLASGFKFFGKNNWYPKLAALVLRSQQPDGSWGDDPGTAYALLFLSRGRHPIMMNKLRFDGFWANRPRDVANLAKYASKQMERPLNWQVVPIKGKWTDWLDSPVLYLASHIPPRLSTEDIDKLRQYVDAGGMLFVQADGGSPTMTGFARDLARKLFPRYEMSDIPRGSPLLSVLFKLETHPELKVVTNGSRVLMVFSPGDLSRHWQLREQRTAAGRPLYDLGINMFLYSAGKAGLRNRLQSSYVSPVAEAPTLTLKIARVTYSGNWDPEPYAWTRFARWFHRQTGYALDVEPVALRDLNAKDFPFAHLTGTAAFVPSTEEVDTVKKYVESGGVLLVDLTGGTGAFDETMRNTLFARAFPLSIAPRLIQPTHPLLSGTADGMEDLSHGRLRPYAIQKLGNPHGGFLSEIAAGKGHLIFTSLDITSGLLNTGTWGIVGFDPGYAQSLMKNAILWTTDGQKDDAALR